MPSNYVTKLIMRLFKAVGKETASFKSFQSRGRNYMYFHLVQFLTLLESIKRCKKLTVAGVNQFHSAFNFLRGNSVN